MTMKLEKRHDLEFIKVIDEKGILNEYCGEFTGLERLEARPIIVKSFRRSWVYRKKIEEHTHQVGHCYRCKNIVEPFISQQWFLSSEMAQESIRKTKKQQKRAVSGEHNGTLSTLHIG